MINMTNVKITLYYSKKPSNHNTIISLPCWSKRNFPLIINEKISAITVISPARFAIHLRQKKMMIIFALANIKNTENWYKLAEIPHSAKDKKPIPRSLSTGWLVGWLDDHHIGIWAQENNDPSSWPLVAQIKCRLFDILPNDIIVTLDKKSLFYWKLEQVGSNKSQWRCIKKIRNREYASIDSISIFG